MRPALLAAAIAVSSLACRSQVEHTVNPKPDLEASVADTHVPQFSDIPVPQGFLVRKDRLESYAAEAGIWRSGRLLYRGQGRTLDAVAYFEERLPHHGWVLVDRGTGTESAFLVFRKGDSTARLDLRAAEPRGSVDLEVKVATSRAGSLVALPASSPAANKN